MYVGGSVISSVEFHGNMSLVIFMSGCPLTCRYCHNVELLDDTTEKSFEEIKEEITEYTKYTSLYFILESLTNFANNGRVDPSVAKIASMLGIRIVGKANEGELKPLVKCCGEKKALSAIIERIENTGYKGGKVRIAYCMNEDAARKIAVELRKKYENSDIKIYHTAGLCSFYAEKGGLLVGFEKSEA